jgi:hypothetical protein
MLHVNLVPVTTAWRVSELNWNVLNVFKLN